MSSLQDTWSLCGGFALTYLIHSTCLLSFCWLATLVVNRHFHAFHCQAWKCAMLVGIATTVFAFVSGSVFDARLSWSRIVENRNTNRLSVLSDGTAKFIPSTSESDSTSTHMEPVHSQINESILPEGTDAISWVAERAKSDPDNSQGVAVPSSYVETAGANREWQLSPLLLKSIGLITFSLFVLGMIRFVIRWNSYRCLLQSCQPCNHRVSRTIRRIETHHSRAYNTTVLVSALARQPFAMGLVRWKIVLPSGLESQLATDELYALLAHELGHLQRGDLIWQWIGELICNCLAIQPLNFIARRQWQRSSEFLADRWSCDHSRASPVALAKCLTIVAEWISEKGKMAPLTSAFLEKSGMHLTSRVEQLMRVTPVTAPRRPIAWIVRAAIVGGCVAICPLAGLAPHCIPSHAMGVEAETSTLSSPAWGQWNDAEQALQCLQADLERLVDGLQTQQRSPFIDQIISDLELRAASISKRASTISRNLHNKETQ